MKDPKNAGEPLDTRKYLTKFDGFDIQEADSQNTDEENTNQTIVLDKWVRLDFPDMGFVSYSELDPP